jgi:hypothetical protein
MIAQVFEVNIFIFSTRAAALWIKPIGYSGSKAIALLHHVDSILATTYWYYIDVSDRPRPFRDWYRFEVVDNDFAATKKGYYKKQFRPRVPIGNDEKMKNVIEEELIVFYRKEWLKLKSKNEKSNYRKENSELVGVFLNTIKSKKNTPGPSMADILNLLLLQQLFWKNGFFFRITLYLLKSKYH